MESKDRELCSMERVREEDKPGVLKRVSEDEQRVSYREAEEEVRSLPNRDRILDEMSTWKKDAEEEERIACKRDEKEDQANALVSTLISDEKIDERNGSRGEVKEGELSTSERDEKKEELIKLKRDDKQDEAIMLERVEKDELNTLNKHEKEDEKMTLKRDEKDGGWNTPKTNEELRILSTLKMFEKEDAQNILRRDDKEDEQGALKMNKTKDEGKLSENGEKEDEETVLGRDEKEDETGVSMRNKEEETEPKIPKREYKEEAILPNSHKIEVAHVIFKMDEEENRNVLYRGKIDNDHGMLNRDVEEANITVQYRNERENKHIVLERDENESDPSFTVRDIEDEPNTPNSDTKEDEIILKRIETKEEPGGQEGQSPSAMGVFEEAVRVAGEAFHQISFNGPILPQLPTPGHRRTRSDTGAPGHRRTNSFQRLKMQMQRAWRGVSNLREDSRPSFNPEVLANQKRQWYQLHSSKALDQMKYKEPTSLFEHFIIVGLHPETNLEAVEEAFAKRKKWEMEMEKADMMNYRMLPHRGPQFPILEPQILFKFPPGKKLDMRPKDLATFCFPGGVKAGLLERTPSLSDLNELVYGQEHLGRDDSSFIFSLKVADDATLYGVCLHVSEIVQRPPGILSTSSPLHSSGGGSRFLVSAPRCYCLLTRVPFFELHFELLNSMIAQERLKRITEFVSEMSLAASDCSPLAPRVNDKMNGNLESPGRDYLNGWMASAIPVDCAMALTAAAAGFISDDEITSSSQKVQEPRSPDSVTASDASDASNIKEIEKDGKKASQCFDDNASDSCVSRSDGPERIFEYFESGQASPEIGTFSSFRICPMECTDSSESVFSSARSMVSDEVDYNTQLSTSETDFGDDLIMEWARDHKNDLLQIICGYHSIPIPLRGREIVFQPLEHLQAIEYMRPSISALGLSEECMDSIDASEVNARLAADEEALSLSIWTTATVCRVLSLESVLALLAGALLEKQVVIVCPNLGVLSATVLSLVPMIRPFQWQSLLLPVLPGRMFDFLDAPVPFLVGIQSKPADFKIKTSNLIQVNVVSDQVKTCHMPSLPRRRELMAQLSPIHARLAHQSSVARRHPVYRCNEVQAEAATQFLTVMRQYMESLCSDLRSHTITSVQSNSDRVSLLLKDSFIDSFPGRDRPFIKLFVDTQLFSVLSDSRLSSFENGRL